MALASPPLIGWAKYDFLSGQSFCFCDWKESISYTFFMVIVCFGGPCSVMSFCYYKILREVRRSRKRIAAANNASGINSENSSISTISNNNSTLRRGNGHVNGAFIRGESLETEKKSRFSSIHEALTRQLSKRLARVEPIDPPTTNPSETVKQGVSGAGNSSPTGSLASKQGVSGSPTLNGSPKRDSKYQQAVGTNKAPRIRIQEACLRRTISSDSRGGSIKSLIGGEKQQNENPSGKSSPKRGPTVRKLSSSMLAVPGLKSALGSRKRRAKTASERRRKQEELKLTKSFLVVILVFISCWFPFCITMFWSVFSPHPVMRAVDMTSLLLGFFNSCCNPVIYGVMNTRFRAGYKQIFFTIFSCCRCGKPDDKTRPQRSLGSITGTIGAGYQDDASFTA